MHGGRRRFHIPPCHAEPAAREVVLKSAGWRGGGFPAHENARPQQGGPGIFMCGCRGGITHYTLPSARCAPRDTPGPRMRLCPSLKSGLRRRFCRLTCTVSVAAKTPPKGRGRWTKDGADWPVTIKFLLPNGHKNSTCPKADAIINANRMLTVIQKTCRKAAFHQSLETSGLQPANAHGARACSVFRR